jgi:hypothetical protein
MRCDVQAIRCARGVAAVALCALTACEPAPLDDDAEYAPAFAAPACRPNDDGTITKDELPFVVGAVSRVRVATGPVEVDVVGTDEDGVRTWDFSRPDPETEPVGELTLSTMDDQWFASSFPNADYAGPLVPGGALQGPLVVDDDGVKLLGAASAEPDPPEGRTIVVYDEPVVLYPFPIEGGARVQSVATASNAKLFGLPTALTDDYIVEVTGRGTLILPDLILENTQRVTIRLERTLLAGDARQVTQVFVHECLGEVVRVVSEAKTLADDIPDEFTTASEIRRLSL